MLHFLKTVDKWSRDVEPPPPDKKTKNVASQFSKEEEAAVWGVWEVFKSIAFLGGVYLVGKKLSGTLQKARGHPGPFYWGK